MMNYIEDYSFHRVIQAPRQHVFKFLGTIECIREWWENPVSGNAGEGGIVQFQFNESGEFFQIEVEELHYPSRVQWHVLEETQYGSWQGTKIIFELVRTDFRSCYLNFCHTGLTSDLACYKSVKKEWDNVLTNFIHVCEEVIDHGAGYLPVLDTV